MAGLLGLIIAFHAGNLPGQTWRTYVGWDALSEEFGAALPDGSGKVVSHVEAQLGGIGGPYAPDPANTDFLNPPKNFVDLSGLMQGVSSHGTGVGRNFYGNTQSISPGVTDVFVNEANDWINVVTGFASSGVPAAQPYAVQNHSWIGNGAPISVAQNILARVDYMANVNDLNIVAGTGNSGVTPMFLAPCYNTITVGVTSGNHATGATTFYGTGRVKPEIVGPANVTSFSTPMVSSLAALLGDAANGTNADNNEAIKAIILAGATKVEFANWSNTPIVPLHFTFGVGEVNAYNSYKIFLAGETDGQPSPPASAAGPRGWDFGVSPSGSVRFYTIELTQPADHLSVVLTWNIEVTDSNSSHTVFTPATSLPNLNMLVSGPIGLKNSNGSTHNIEHVYVRDLPAGVYSIAVFGDPNLSTDYGLAWRAASISSVATSSLNVVTGGTSSGGLTNVSTSDNNYLVVRNDPAAGPTDEGVVVEFEATMPINMPNSIEFNLEARASTLNLEQKVEVFNFESGLFETFDTSSASLSDSQFDAYVTGELFRFFSSVDGTMRARVSWKPVGPVFQYPWTIRIDRAAWSIGQ